MTANGSTLRSALSSLAVLLVFVPVFFQLDGRLYSDPGSLTEPRGTFTNLPLPISVLVCGIALAAMSHRWLRQPQTLLLLSTVLLMFLTSLVAGSGAISWPKTKLLLFQFGAPMAGFALGRELGRDERCVIRSGKWLLLATAIVIVAQLCSTWFRHRSVVLSSDIFGLEVYGHLQYVPVILMVGYVSGLFAVCSVQPYRMVPVAGMLFVPVMSAYVGASMSITAVLGLWMSLFLLAWTPGGRRHAHVLSVMAVTAIVLSSAYVVAATTTSSSFQAKFLGLKQSNSSAPGEAPPVVSADDGEPQILPNLVERFVYWDYFLAGSTSDLGAFLFGHAEQPDIREYPSAHNYYLDLLYNFGFLSLVPLATLIAWTARQSWQLRTEFGRYPELVGLTFVTFFLLVADNGLKVGMRQLYPGITTFMLWGMLSISLERAHQARIARREESSLLSGAALHTGWHAGPPVTLTLGAAEPRRATLREPSVRIAGTTDGSGGETTGSNVPRG